VNCHKIAVNAIVISSVVKRTHIQPTELFQCGLQHVLGNCISRFRYSLL